MRPFSSNVFHFGACMSSGLFHDPPCLQTFADLHGRLPPDCSVPRKIRKVACMKSGTIPAKAGSTRSEVASSREF